MKEQRSERVRPLEPDEWDDQTRSLLGGTVEPVAALEGRKAPSRRPLPILSTIAHHPKLLQPFLGFAATLATQGVLPRRESELLALRAAWNCGSPFEWGHHVIYARSAGLTEEEIERLPRGASAPEWSPRDRCLLQAADELHAGYDVTNATWGRLREHFDAAQLVELTFVVGNYTMLSMVANATGVPLEPDLPELPRADWTAADMLELGHLHADLEARRELDPLMDTLVAEPVYEFHPLGLRMAGGERVRRYYRQFFDDFMEKIVGYRLLEEWANETSVGQEYDITVEVDGEPETHRALGILYVEHGPDGARLGGERIYGSERLVRLFAGNLFTELTPLDG
jgi:alkylhydroperoxidase family enzyme